MYVSDKFYLGGWIICFILQGLFVIRGLTCNKASVHYKNCLTLKIKLNFCILCALLTSSFIFIAMFVNQSDYKLSFKAFIVLGNFVLIKCKCSPATLTYA
jgi:hypothetical protein